MGVCCVSPGELRADINQTLEAFEHILHLYRSGLHLDDLPPSELTGKSWPDPLLLFFSFCFFWGGFWEQISASASVFISYPEKKKEEKKMEKKKKGGAFFSAPAVLTGLLGSWNERTRPTKWD